MKFKLHIPSEEDRCRSTMNLTSIINKLNDASNVAPIQLRDMIRSNDAGSVVSYCGSDVRLKGLFHMPGVIAICTATLQAKTIVQNHFHGRSKECIEIVYCQSGSVNIYFRDNGELEDHKIKSGSIIIIPAGVAHSVEAFENSVLLCITIPADQDYPTVDNSDRG